MSLLKLVISKIVKPFAHICIVSFQVIPLYKSGEKHVFYKLQANICITTILKNPGETIIL